MLNLMLMRLIVKMTRGCSGEIDSGFCVSIIWETLLKAYPKWVSPCRQNTEDIFMFFILLFIFFKETAVFFVKLELNYTVRCFGGF